MRADLQAEIKPVCKNKLIFLTDSLLEYKTNFAILARMNAFRATILVLLVLTVGLMFYAFVWLIPARQEQYQMYHTQLKINEYDQRQMEHDARMARLGTEVDTPEVAAAREAAAQEDKKNSDEINAAEEHSVIASVKRKQEIEAASTAAEDAAGPDPIGSVTAYLDDCAVILFKATGNMPVNDGLLIALRRGDYIVCEATVDGRDDESGQYTAAVKQAKFGGASDPAAEANRIPRPGDEIIVSPFLSSRDLRLEAAGAQSADIPEASEAQALPEIDAELVPVP
jgi:hypothetical protein